MATVITNPTYLRTDNPGTLSYYNPSVMINPGDSYVLKNVLGSVVSNPFTTANVPLPSSTFSTTISVDNLSGMSFNKTNGNLYVNSFSLFNNIYAIDPSGVASVFATLPTGGGIIPYFSTFDNSGNLYVTDLSNSIFKITSAAVVSPFATTLTSTTLTLSWGIAFNNGLLYISDKNTNQIYTLTLDGLTLTSFCSDASLNGPGGLAFDASNYLYVVSFNGSQIFKIDPSGTIIGTFYFPLLINNPYTLTIDNFGNMYVPNYGNNNIIKINSTGTTAVIFSTGYNSPFGVAFDSMGNLFVSNNTSPNGIISKITIPNTFTFSNVIIPSSGLNQLFIYDQTAGNTVASDIFIEVTAICFREGTKILCLIDKKEKYVPIEDIQEDTFVKIYTKDRHFSSQYKKAKTIVKGSIVNSNEETIHKLYKLSKSKNPALIADLYVTGSHALLHDNLSEDEFEKMNNLIDCYNNYNVRIEDEENMDEETLENLKNAIKYYNDYKLMLNDKYKLIAYFDQDFEEVCDNKIHNIYHIVLENENKYENYGIYANGIIAESTCEVSLSRFPGHQKINATNKGFIEHKKGIDINDKLTNYIKNQNKRITQKINDTLDTMEDSLIKKIDYCVNNEVVSKSYTCKRIQPTKKNITYKKSKML